MKRFVSMVLQLSTEILKRKMNRAYVSQRSGGGKGADCALVCRTQNHPIMNDELKKAGYPQKQEKADRFRVCQLFDGYWSIIRQAENPLLR